MPMTNCVYFGWWNRLQSELMALMVRTNALLLVMPPLLTNWHLADFNLCSFARRGKIDRWEVILEYQPSPRKITYFAGKGRSVAAMILSSKELNTSCHCPSPQSILSRPPRLNSRHLASTLMWMCMGTYAWTYYRISGHLLMMLGLSCYQFRVCLEVID